MKSKFFFIPMRTKNVLLCLLLSVCSLSADSYSFFPSSKQNPNFNTKLKKTSETIQLEEEEKLLIPDPVITPPPQELPPIKKEKGTFKAWGAFLYWQAMEDYLDIGYRAPHAEPNDLLGYNFMDGEMILMDPTFQMGYKVGAAYQTPSDWEVFAEYTSYNPKASAHVTKNPGGFLYSRWIVMNLISDTSVDSISSEWKLKMDVINIEGAKELHFGKRLTLSPHIGAALYFMDHVYNGRYTGLTTPYSNISDTLLGHTTSNAWGIGPRMGLLAKCKIFNHLSFRSDIATDFLVTMYKVAVDHKNLANTVFVHQSNKFYTLRPEFEMYAGLSLDFERFNLGLGGDFQIWWEQNVMRWYSDYTFVATPQGDLCLLGLRLSMQVAF